LWSNMKRAYLKLAPPRLSRPHQLYAMQVCSENESVLSPPTRLWLKSNTKVSSKLAARVRG
jgi:hypothetical protein